jgi:hypothetical protein
MIGTQMGTHNRSEMSRYKGRLFRQPDRSNEVMKMVFLPPYFRNLSVRGCQSEKIEISGLL